MKKLVIVFFLAFLCAAAHAQNLVGEGYELLFETPPGHRPSANVNQLEFTFTDYRDMTGDGKPELVTWREDDEGNPIELVVFDMVSRTQVWSMTIREIVPAGLVGTAPTFPQVIFVDLDHDGGFREPLFIFGGAGEDWIVIIDPETKTPEFELGGVLRAIVGDWNGDGFDELIVGNSDTRTVQVWGNAENNTTARKRPR